MTDVVLTTPNPTTLAEFLTGERLPGRLARELPDLQLIPYLGVATPQHLDAPAKETAALFQGAAVHDLGWLRRIAVRGEDRLRWLSGMVTNAVETLPDASGAYNLVLNAQGRIQGDLYVWRNGDALELAVAADQTEALLAHFDRFIIMDDVELVTVESQSAIGVTGPKASSLLQAMGLKTPEAQLTSITAEISRQGETMPVRIERGYGVLVPHFVLWAQTANLPHLWQLLNEAGAQPVGAAAVETLRIAEGIPAYAVDIQSRDLAQETSQDRALNYAKGCYLGQEIVERIRSRGQVHRHLRAIELSPASPEAAVPPIGTEIKLEGTDLESKPAATLTSVAAVQLLHSRRIFALGMVRAEAEVGSKQLIYDGGTARILLTPPQLTGILNSGPQAAHPGPQAANTSPQAANTSPQAAKETA